MKQRTPSSRVRSKYFHLGAAKGADLLGATVDTERAHLDVKGVTRIESLQSERHSHSQESGGSTSVGVAFSSNGGVIPTGSASGYHGEHHSDSKTVDEVSGIRATEGMTGSVENVDMKGGFFLGGEDSNLKLKGQITSSETHRIRKIQAVSRLLSAGVSAEMVYHHLM